MRDGERIAPFPVVGRRRFAALSFLRALEKRHNFAFMSPMHTAGASLKSDRRTVSLQDACGAHYTSDE
jgi:hypothetical protein